MEARRAHAWHTGQVISDRILDRSHQATQNQLQDGGPVQKALLESFARVEKQCAITREKVANKVPEILAQHVPESQVGVFLAALYQLMCTQQQGITSMVVTQAGVPVHLGVHSWAMQVAMTQLFAQVIPGLGSLSGLSPVTTPMGAHTAQLAAQTEQVQYTAIPSEGSTMVSTGLFPGKQVRCDGMATRPIYLGNDTDSGISSTGLATPVKTLGSKHQLLTSTPKTKPKLLVTAQQHRNELVAMRQGAPYCTHVRPLQHKTSQTRPYGMGLYSWKSAVNPCTSGNSGFISVEEHTQLTTAALMQRDAPCQPAFDEVNVVSIQDNQQSDVEMVSIIDQPEQHTEDSSADSTAEDSNHHSNASEMESDQDHGSGHHSDPDSDHNSNPGSDLGSRSRSGSKASGSESGSDSSEENGGDFADMFKAKQKCSNTPKKPGHWKHSKVPEKPESRTPSSSWSRSRETENQKRCHVASLENMPNPDKPDWKKKKS